MAIGCWHYIDIYITILKHRNIRTSFFIYVSAFKNNILVSSFTKYVSQALRSVAPLQKT